MTTAAEISERITESVMAQKLAPGARLGEQQLALLFNCSRTMVREALIRLAARGIVTVSSRRGWYVVEVRLEVQGPHVPPTPPNTDEDRAMRGVTR